MINLYELMTENVNGATFISIDMKTVPTLRGGKKNPFKGRVEKLVEGAQVMVFQNKTGSGYENMVMRRLEKEGKNPYGFELGPRKWGHRIPNTCFIEHQKDGVDKYYLEVIFLKTGTTTYLVDGQPTDPSEIEGLVATQETAEQGGLSDKVVIRTVAVENIEKITVAKQTHTQFYFDKK
jgi:hypothetical protein